MRILFLHNNFPAQYRWLARAVAADKSNQVVFGSIRANGNIPGVSNVLYKPLREPKKETHHYLQNAESAVLHGQAVYRMSMGLKKQGFTPDVVCAHAGWGPAHFVKEAFPDTHLLSYFEWFYNAIGSDFEFLQDIKHPPDDYLRLRMKNSALLTDLTACDWGLSPTSWQWSQLPDVYQSKVTVMHDGINTDFMKPNPEAKLKIKGLDLSDKKEIVTYVARGMEQYRGFPEFLQAVEILHKRRPQTHFVVVGEDRVAYGRTLPNGQSFKTKMLSELDLDLNRVHFPGLVNYGDLLTLFQASSVHVYLTVPFVLSWSMLEAMSAGCLILGSDTQPVRELIEDGKNGLLVDFFSPEKIADRMEEALENQAKFANIRKNARQTILDQYDYKDLLPKQIQLMRDVAQGKPPKKGGKLGG